MIKLDTTLLALLSVVGIIAITFIVLYFTKKCSIAQCRKTPGAVCPKSLVCVPPKDNCDSKKKICIDKGSTPHCPTSSPCPTTKPCTTMRPVFDDKVRKKFSKSVFFTKIDNLIEKLLKIQFLNQFLCVPDPNKIYYNNYVEINAIYAIPGATNFMNNIDICIINKLLKIIPKKMLDPILDNMVSYEENHTGPDHLKGAFIAALIILCFVEEVFHSEHIKNIINIIPLKAGQKSLYDYLTNLQIGKFGGVSGIKVLENLKYISTPNAGIKVVNELINLGLLLLPNKNLNSQIVTVDVNKIQAFKDYIDKDPVSCKSLEGSYAEDYFRISSNLLQNIVFEIIFKSGCTSP